MSASIYNRLLDMMRFEVNKAEVARVKLAGLLVSEESFKTILDFCTISEWRFQCQEDKKQTNATFYGVPLFVATDFPHGFVLPIRGTTHAELMQTQYERWKKSKEK